MTKKQVFRAGLTGLAGILLCTASSSFVAAQEANAAVYAAMKGNPKLRLVQTNFAGDAVSIIDPATNKVVGEIPGIEMAHGINVAKDNSQIYVAQESTASILVVDGKTLRITKRIPVSGSPNLIQLTPDGKKMYVSINLRWDVVSNFPQLQAEPSGGIDIVDVASLEKIKSISSATKRLPGALRGDGARQPASERWTPSLTQIGSTLVAGSTAVPKRPSSTAIRYEAQERRELRQPCAEPGRGQLEQMFQLGSVPAGTAGHAVCRTRVR